MGEKLSLTRPDGKGLRFVTVVDNGTFSIAGRGEYCQRVLVRVNSQGRIREIPMVSKRLGSFIPGLRSDEKGSDRYISVWKGLKEAGVPVVPTVRKKSDNEVLLTDLTKDGSIVYGKHQAMEPELLPQDPASRAVHKAFLEISMDSISEAATSILRKATDKGIQLARDGALDLVVNTDRWYLLALDISKTTFGEYRAEEGNRHNLYDTISWLLSLQGYLRYIHKT